MKSKKKLRVRLVFLYMGSFIASIAPLVIVLALNWGDYTKTPGETVKLCFGGALVLCFILLKVVGKLQMPRRVVLFGILLLLAYLLKVLLDDIVLILGMALIGEIADLVLFQRAIRITKENIAIEKTSDATASKVETVIKNYFNGRT